MNWLEAKLLMMLRFSPPTLILEKIPMYTFRDWPTFKMIYKVGETVVTGFTQTASGGVVTYCSRSRLELKL